MRNNPERAVPIIEKVMAKRDSGSACLRRHALFVLATSNDPAASKLLLQAVGDPDQEVRQGAVFWLARTDDPRAVTVLDSVLQATKDEDVQQAALFALSTKNDPAARRLLRSYVTRPGLSPDLAQMALFQVARDPETTPAELKQFYANAKTTEMKQQILVAMMTRRDKDTQWLMQIATDKSQDSELRQQALVTLVQSDIATADLLKLFDSLPDDDEMQGMMVMLMARRPNDPAITDRLINIAKTSPNKELRQQAVFWLSQSKDPRATKLLEEMLEQ
jgi:HEAT repeat protein